jgi:hypothetical protein
MGLLKQYAHDYKIHPQIGTAKIVNIVTTNPTAAFPEVVTELKFSLVFFDHNFRWKHIIQLTSMQFIFAV